MFFRDRLLSTTTKFASLAAVAWIAPSSLHAQEYLNGIEWTPPALVTPGATNDAPPSDAVVLFDGKDFSHWKNADKWKIEDGAMVAGRGAITSVDEFGDCQVHIEWSAPSPAKGDGQGRGNSGVFLMGIYELQVLDSFQNPTYFDGQARCDLQTNPTDGERYA
jgi:hypothetical protein